MYCVISVLVLLRVYVSYLLNSAVEWIGIYKDTFIYTYIYISLSKDI